MHRRRRSWNLTENASSPPSITAVLSVTEERSKPSVSVSVSVLISHEPLTLVDVARRFRSSHDFTATSEILLSGAASGLLVALHTLSRGIWFSSDFDGPPIILFVCVWFRYVIRHTPWQLVPTNP